MPAVAPGRALRVAFFAGSRAWRGAYCRLMAGAVADEFSATTAVLIENDSLRFALGRARSLLRRWRRRGMLRMLADLRDRPLRQACATEMERVAEQRLRAEGTPQGPPALEIKRCRTVNGGDAEEALRSFDPDVVVQIGAGILKANIFGIPRHGVLNVHHGYLPLIRGADSVLWAIYYGRREWVGVSVHVVDEGLDTGPILARRRIETEFGVHPGELHAQATLVGRDLLLGELRRLAEGRPAVTVQDPSASHYRSFFPGAEYLRLRRADWHPVASLPVGTSVGPPISALGT